MKNGMKKVISIVLCYVMLLSMLPMTVIPASAATYGGSGTEADPYIASTQSELVSLLASYNTAGVYIKLDSDITLTSSYVPGVLNANLDGDFHKITAQTHFFTTNKGTLKNFYYTDTVTRTNTGASYAGIVCNENQGFISGVIATGAINNSCSGYSAGDEDYHYANYAGIISGPNSGTIINCAAFGSVSLYCRFGSHAGGIASGGKVINCYADVSVSATGSSRYGSSTQHPITLGTVTNSYFNSDTYTATATGGYATADMKTEDFVATLNSNTVSVDSKWVTDTANKNNGYPVLIRALNATVTPSKTNVLLEGAESVTLSCDDPTAEIYYTLDGTAPTIASTKYTAPFQIGDTSTLQTVTYKNGIYGAVQTFLFACVEGSGTKDDPYQIDSEAALHAIPELANDAYYCLTQNITLQGEMISIGDFRGHFDGQGYAINNVYASVQIAGFTNSNYGLIENLTLRIRENSELVAKAGFAYQNHGVLYNCRIEGTVNSKGMTDLNTGGLVANNYGRIEKCSYIGSFYSNCANKGGGLAGLNEGTIAYCEFIGDAVNIKDISFRCYPDFQGYVGGLVGYNSGTLQYSNITASLVSSFSGNYTGVIVGPLVGAGSATMLDCTASVDTVQANYAYLEWGTTKTNSYTGTISGAPIPEAHAHTFEMETLVPVCGQKRQARITCSCGISVATETWTDDYYQLSHVGEWVEVTSPDCDNAGLKTFTCTTCGHVMEETIPATGHSWDAGTVTTAPTCANAGVMTYSCPCGETKTETIAATGEHQYPSGSYIEYPSSTAPGVVMHSCVCTICAFTYTNLIPYTVTSPATHLYEGTGSATCDECNNHITVFIPRLEEHEWDNGTVTTAPTCVDTGVMTYSCPCGETKTETIAATGEHTYQCTQDFIPISSDMRIVYHYCRCSVCDDVYSTYLDCNITTPPTHMSEGAGTAYCSQCQTTITLFITTVPDHEWDEGTVTTEPTHMTEGVKTFTCPCGDSYTETVEKLTDHEWDEGTVTTAPTYSASGVKTYTCPCGESYTEDIDPLPVTEQSPQVVVENARAILGGTVTVNLLLKNNPGIAGMILTLRYDTSAMTLINVTNGTILQTMTSATNIVLNNGGLGDSNANGVLVTLTFQIFDSAPEGDYQVEAILRECSNNALEAVDMATVAGTLSVIDCLYGDADGNGVINLNDAILLSNYLAHFDYETGSSSVTVSDGADADGNGTVNLNDAVLLNNYLAHFDYDTGESSVVLGPRG